MDISSSQSWRAELVGAYAMGAANGSGKPKKNKKIRGKRKKKKKNKTAWGRTAGCYAATLEIGEKIK